MTFPVLKRGKKAKEISESAARATRVIVFFLRLNFERMIVIHRLPEESGRP